MVAGQVQDQAPSVIIVATPPAPLVDDVGLHMPPQNLVLLTTTKTIFHPTSASFSTNNHRPRYTTHKTTTP